MLNFPFLITSKNLKKVKTGCNYQNCIKIMLSKVTPKHRETDFFTKNIGDCKYKR